MPNPEENLVAQAKTYLKKTYGEDTVSMSVTQNAVAGGDGTLAVDCTVSVGGGHSDWSKVFHFKNGEIVRMNWRQR